MNIFALVLFGVAIINHGDFYGVVFVHTEHDVLRFEVIEGEPSVVDGLDAVEKLHEYLKNLRLMQFVMLHVVLESQLISMGHIGEKFNSRG